MAQKAPKKGPKTPEKTPPSKRIATTDIQKNISDLRKLIQEKDPKIDMEKECLKRFKDEEVVYAIRYLREQMLRKLIELNKLDKDNKASFRHLFAQDVIAELENSPEDPIIKGLGNAARAETLPNDRGERLYILNELIERHKEMIKEKMKEKRKEEMK